MNDGYEEVLRNIASSDPTPGGGSVSALSLAHAQALTIMVARLTIGKKKWSEGQDMAELIISKWDKKIPNTIQLSIKDALAFDSVMDAYRLPKGDEDENKIRDQSIREATIGAARTPLTIASEACDLLTDIAAFSHLCNSNAMTDIASAAELCSSAVLIAHMNVRINLDFIEGADVDEISQKIEDIVQESESLMEGTRAIVSERLGW